MFLILPPPPWIVVGSQELKSNIRKGKHYAVKILLIAIWHENFNRRNYVYNRTNLTIVRRNNYWNTGTWKRIYSMSHKLLKCLPYNGRRGLIPNDKVYLSLQFNCSFKIKNSPKYIYIRLKQPDALSQWINNTTNQIKTFISVKFCL